MSCSTHLTDGRLDVKPLDVAGVLLLAVLFAGNVVCWAGLWRMFAKAGHPGWAAIVPGLNLAIMCRVAGYSAWWALVYPLSITFIVVLNLTTPVVFAVFLIELAIIARGITRSFERGVVTMLGLTLLFPVFWCILGFGRAIYRPTPASPD